MNYFNKLPTITYDGFLSKNLLARARLSDNIRQQKTIFYPYTIENNDRADILSNDYYGKPGYSWLIWLTNNIIDPYFGFPLSDSELTAHIINKYKSYDRAGRNIMLYRNNWYDYTDARLTVSGYNSLPSHHKKYYEPIVDVYLNVNSYKRKADDTTINTNQIVSLTVSPVSGTFVIGEEVQTNGTNYGFVTYVSATTITVQHVNGTLSGTITGQDSKATATVGTSTTLYQTVAATDPTFWSPVTYLDFEMELNEIRKTIKLLDTRYAVQVDNDLSRIMNVR